MLIVDANVLLRAANEHRSASAWLRSALAGTEAVGLARVVLLAFLRSPPIRQSSPRP